LWISNKTNLVLIMQRAQMISWVKSAVPMLAFFALSRISQATFCPDHAVSLGRAAP
jgi:hypothetical protein